MRLFLLLAGLSILLLTGCGLDTITNLTPPDPLNPDGVNFRFRKIEENSEAEFRGFELYYKLYTTSETKEKNLTDHSELLSHGFKRLSWENDDKDTTNRPLVYVAPADRTKEFDVWIAFNVPAYNYARIYTTASLSSSIDRNVRRGVFYSSGAEQDQPKRFRKSDFDSGDGEGSSAAYAAAYGGSPVSMVMYVLSYGLKDLVDPIYSVAVCLSDITITFTD